MVIWIKCILAGVGSLILLSLLAYLLLPYIAKVAYSIPGPVGVDPVSLSKSKWTWVFWGMAFAVGFVVQYRRLINK